MGKRRMEVYVRTEENPISGARERGMTFDVGRDETRCYWGTHLYM